MEIKKILLLFCLLIFCFSCKKEIKNIYNYKILNEDNTLKGFLQNRTTLKGAKRIDTIIRYSKNKVNLDTLIKKYIVTKNGLKNSANNSNYISIKVKDSCYSYSSLDKSPYKICYLGKVGLILNKRRVENIYKFKITHLVDDGVSKHLYFDNNFILVKNEYNSGYAPYFNIEIID